jgi:ankyrin repeat protein
VELLLDSGADVDMLNSRDKTPFDLAWENGKRDVASFLGRRTGNVRAMDTIGSTPPEAGLQDNIPDEIVEQDMDSGNSSSSGNEDSISLHSALVSGQIDAFQRLLDQGADVDERDEKFRTPLHIASWQGRLEIVRTLIKYGADVNALDREGWTSLHWAAQNGLVDLLRLLLDNSADIHATERESSTALHIASGNGRLLSVHFLLERGANVHIQDVYGRTPSQHALLYGHREITQLLSERDVGRE